MGHIRMYQNNIKSNKLKTSIPLAEFINFNLWQEPTKYCTNTMYNSMVSSSDLFKSYSDHTLNFPVQSYLGHNYVFISYNYDSNAILSVLFKITNTSPSWLPGKHAPIGYMTTDMHLNHKSLTMNARNYSNKPSENMASTSNKCSPIATENFRWTYHSNLEERLHYRPSNMWSQLSSNCMGYPHIPMKYHSEYPTFLLTTTWTISLHLPTR